MTEAFSRTERIFGREAMEKLKQSRVAVFGLGGVGGYVVEALARCRSHSRRRRSGEGRRRWKRFPVLLSTKAANSFCLPSSSALGTQ